MNYVYVFIEIRSAASFPDGHITIEVNICKNLQNKS